MAHLLFIDESGGDRESPYEVLAGLAVEDRDLWNLIQSVHQAEHDHFGRRISQEFELELKGKKLLKKKVFRHAAQCEPIPAAERLELTKSCLAKGAAGAGAAVTRRELAALAQAKLGFCARIFEQAAAFRCKAFASIIDRDAPRPTEGGFLRKDFAYLFERFYYFLDETDRGHGIVVFDETEKSRSQNLVNQMHRYFRETATGKLRASKIIPEPLFVHSDLTTLVQVADLTAYIINWGVQVKSMVRERRPELADLAQAVCDLRFRATQERAGVPSHVWSFKVIDDLRSRQDLAATGS